MPLEVFYPFPPIISQEPRVKKPRKDTCADREDWDASVKGDNPQVEYEQRLANKIAEEILKRSKALRMIHSKKSIKSLIGEEAKAFIRQSAP